MGSKTPEDDVVIDATSIDKCKYLPCETEAEKALKNMLSVDKPTQSVRIDMGNGTCIKLPKYVEPSKRVRPNKYPAFILKTSAGEEILLKDIADFKRLLAGAGNDGDGGTTLIDNASDVDELLEKAVSGYYENKIPPEGNKRGGLKTASNKRGSGSFNYDIIQQTLSDKNANELKDWLDEPGNYPSKMPKGLPEHLKALYNEGRIDKKTGFLKGIECAASATMLMYKSFGLIPPDLNRYEIEKSYTGIVQNSDIVYTGLEKSVLPDNKSTSDKLRMKVPGVNKETAQSWANDYFKNSDWAKLTGMNKKNFFSDNLSADETKEYLKNNKGPVRATVVAGQYPNHFVTLTGVRANNDRVEYDETLYQPEKKILLLNNANFNLNDFWTLKFKD